MSGGPEAITDARESKRRIRAEMLARRRAAEPAWRAEASAAIARRALAIKSLLGDQLIALYIAKDEEVDTSLLVRGLLESKGRLAAPRVEGGERLVFHRVERFPEGFRAGAFGILEPDPEFYPVAVDPDEIGALFIPGVAFDRLGHRLGYGKGYYDRWLCRASAPTKIGLAFSFQVLERLPAEAHDVRLDGLVTEQDVLEFD